MPDTKNLTPKRNPAAVPYRSNAPVSRKCSVCKSPNLDAINRMLLGNLVKQDNDLFTLHEIAEWSRQAGHEVSKAALSRHLNNHLPPVSALSAPPVASSKDTLSTHIRKAAEALVQGIYEQVAFEVSEAVASTTRPALTIPLPPQKPTSAGQQAVNPRNTLQEPRKAAPGLPRAKGTRAMPKDFQAALALEQALNRIQVMPQGTRARVVSEVAAQFGVGTATVRRWLSQYQEHGLSGIMAVQRADKGQGRLPAEQIEAIEAVARENSTLSARKVYRLLKETRPELLAYHDKKGKKRVISGPTVNKLVSKVRGKTDGES